MLALDSAMSRHHKKKLTRRQQRALSNDPNVLLFGRRFYGRKLSGVPKDYLRWMIESVTEEKWRSIAESELSRRGLPIRIERPCEPVVSPMTDEDRAAKLREVAERLAASRQRVLFDADEPIAQRPILSSVPTKITIVDSGNGKDCPF